ncbi:hypothetical protein AAY81_08555 [Denitrobacterium detoxificans]|nr:hypothetical protein AAY81_08555 [Denitrobacterium detoxificans]
MFVMTLGMQMLLEFFGDVLSSRPSLCGRDIAWAIRKLGPEELEWRRRAFDERWGFAECGLDGVPMRQVDE